MDMNFRRHRLPIAPRLNISASFPESNHLPLTHLNFPGEPEMLELTAPSTTPLEATNWLKQVEQLGLRFAERAAAADADDHFVSENFADLKSHEFIAAGVPRELGGGGASQIELSNILRELAKYCGSTALAYSMHTHQVATAAWRWHHQQAPVDGLLKRIAAEQIILVSSGGSDWLPSSGTAVRVEGGFRINARKAFASGAPIGDLLMTSAVYEDPDAGATVLHFGVPMGAAGVTLEPTWQTLGMRGTGSHDIVLSDVFVPDAGVSLKREQGKWHLLFHIIAMVAMPLIYSVYVGVAEAARDRAIQQANHRRHDDHLQYLVGGLENELTAAKLALQHMLTTAATNQPGFNTTNQVMIGRTLAAQSVLKVADLAMEIAGGKAFYRSFELERLFRDAQAARYHPLQEGPQRRLTGQLALGCEID
ncbi:acyl-CoA/acyl-ACP dehydrogenase [Kovacikia minuta CCNUW1]|uniref:acyl-CoA dehydrogenase family protein n=1 Tax=Kovacikia minuta TaxID=2931930 RepID=UPI001CCE0344|nr:acyl-CoA dehydrogenase family protein [Kovacikia minuta]UBF25089.1 acyl-CoA/acyl-ACP dehydrogenase [Kovacikia minuta CCNUW1]